MNIPTAIKIGAMTYPVRFDKNLVRDERLFGQINHMTQEIILSGDLTASQQEETLIHEIIEAINSHCELELKHHQIQVLGFMLHQILKDNQLNFGDSEYGSHE